MPCDRFNRLDDAPHLGKQGFLDEHRNIGKQMRSQLNQGRAETEIS